MDDALADAPAPGGLILCAVSGGRDSVCLLDCLWKLGRARDFRVAAAHLNHGMRPTARRDEDLVRALCAERNIPFYTETVDVYALCAVWRLTVEETGRRARYFLRRTAECPAADFIATAHHRDDQAETVLLQLLRGTGPQGLTGIPPSVTASSAPYWIRPAPLSMTTSRRTASPTSPTRRTWIPTTPATASGWTSCPSCGRSTPPP